MKVRWWSIVDENGKVIWSGSAEDPPDLEYEEGLRVVWGADGVFRVSP